MNGMTLFDTPPVDPGEAVQRFEQMLDDAGLPRPDITRHLAEIQMVEFTWLERQLTVQLDLTDGEIEPLDETERDAIRGGTLPWDGPIHVTVPGSPEDPRNEPSIPGVVVHRVPELHPDDVTVVDGIPVTSPSRTLIDCAEEATKDELRAMFERARRLGLLDPDALRAARARVEWRPSLVMLDEVIAEFCP